MFKRLTALSKCLIFLLTAVAAILSYDTRFLGILALVALICYRLSKLKYPKFLGCLIALHLFLIFIKDPDYGVTLYHYDISWLDNFTLQEGLYLLNILLKDVIILNFLQIFLLTSQPSELAASLNQLKLPYRWAYAIGQLLRIGPRFQATYAKLQSAAAAQNKGFTKLDAVRFLLKAKHEDTLTSRHFGKKQGRTWYVQRPLTRLDKGALLLAVFSVIISISLVFINGSRLWNPFR